MKSTVISICVFYFSAQFISYKFSGNFGVSVIFMTCLFLKLKLNCLQVIDLYSKFLEHWFMFQRILTDVYKQSEKIEFKKLKSVSVKKTISEQTFCQSYLTECSLKYESNDLRCLKHKTADYELGFQFKDCDHVQSSSIFMELMDQKEVKNNIFSCMSCNKKFKSKSGVKIHEKTHETDYKCSTCGNIYSTKNKLSRHSVSHIDDRPFKCEICMKAYKRDFELKFHMKTHSGVKDHVCDVCGYKAISNYMIVIHKRRHTKDYKYECSVCNKGFYTKAQLTGHESNHNGQRLYCDVCGANFSQKYNLLNHIKSKHNRNDESSHQCEVCGKHYKIEETFRKHLRTHNESNICKICGRSFTTREYLKIHTLLHNGDRCFVCEICGKGFNSPAYLRTHRRTHTGQRPYKCEFQMCDRSFTQRSSLVVHMKQHSNHRLILNQISNVLPDNLYEDSIQNSFYPRTVWNYKTPFKPTVDVSNPLLEQSDNCVLRPNVLKIQEFSALPHTEIPSVEILKIPDFIRNIELSSEKEFCISNENNEQEM